GSADDAGVIDSVPPAITVDAPAQTTDTTPTITGTTDATPGSTVTVTVTGSDGTPQTLTATVTPGGTYTVDVPAALAEGSYTVTANVTDPAGNTGTASDTGIVAALAATEDTGTSYTVADLTGETGSGLTVTSVSVGSGTATVTGGGSAVSYTPVANYSGETTITYTLSDGSTSTALVHVAPVTDAPTAMGNFTFDIASTSFATYSWSNIQSVSDGTTTWDLEKNGGDGADSADLVNAIDYLYANDYASATTGTTTSIVSSSLPTYQAKLITGYVFLEAGSTYSFSGTVDDSGTIVIGDVTSGHANWAGTNTSTASDFTVAETGFYTFDLYLHNAAGVGNYNFSILNADSGSAVQLFGSEADIQQAISSYNYLSLGSFDDGSDADGNGYYALQYGYTGTEGTGISLTGVGAKLSDTDGSEHLTMTVTGLAEGATLNYDVTHADGSTGTGTAVADSSGTITVSGEPGDVEFSYLTLNIPAGDYNVQVTATAQDAPDASKSATTEFTVHSTAASSGFSALAAAADTTDTSGTTTADSSGIATATAADTSSTVALYSDTTSVWDETLKTASNY
ncbi:Ig-like domain-containing protein, partial [Paenirhodobacter enshiensis]